MIAAARSLLHQQFCRRIFSSFFFIINTCNSIIEKSMSVSGRRRAREGRPGATVPALGTAEIHLREALGSAGSPVASSSGSSGRSPSLWSAASNAPRTRQLRPETHIQTPNIDKMLFNNFFKWQKM